MKKSLGLLLCMAFFNVSAYASHFTACEGTYALCTTAACTPVAGKKSLVMCNCDVKTGYSVGTKACKPVKKIPKGELLYSRYFPIKSYAICNNHRPWAWCLDKPCLVDKNNPDKAVCACSVVKNLGAYIIVTESYSKSTCTTGIISSATVKDATAVTNFLKTQPALPPYPIKIIKP